MFRGLAVIGLDGVVCNTLLFKAMGDGWHGPGTRFVGRCGDWLRRRLPTEIPAAPLSWNPKGEAARPTLRGCRGAERATKMSDTSVHTRTNTDGYARRQADPILSAGHVIRRILVNHDRDLAYYADGPTWAPQPRPSMKGEGRMAQTGREGFPTTSQ